MTEDAFIFQKIAINDFPFLKSILQDEELMLLGWGKTYTDAEVMEWIEKISQQYTEYGYSYFIVKSSIVDKPIGIAGILRTTIDSQLFDEIAYILKKEYQGRGYATKIARELIGLAFAEYHLAQVVGQVAIENSFSKKVLEKNGMSYAFSYQREQNDGKKKYLVYQLSNDCG